MTLDRARLIFKTHMAAARSGKKLTAYDKNQFHKAQAVLRAHRKPAMNPKRKSGQYTEAQTKRYQVGFDHGYLGQEMSDRSIEYKKGYIQGVHYREKRIRGRKSNPDKPTLIYQQVDRIYATKRQSHICDSECKKNGHRYFHDFTSKPRMYGLPNGDLLITTNKF